MGLLDKAAHSGSLLQKADKEIKKKTVITKTSPDVKWLTQQSFYASPAETGKKDDAPFITAEEKSVIGRITALKDGVETPGQIYSLLREELSIEKGAILIQEAQTGMFMPWALTGFDKTTNHRLRIPRSAVLPLFTEENPACLYLDNEDSMVFLRPFFSIREFGLLEHVLLCPFNYESEFLGFLLITASQLFEGESMDRTCSFVLNLAKAAAPVLYHTRERKLEKLSFNQPAVKSDIMGEIKSISKNAKKEKKELLLLIFSIDEAARHVHKHVSEADLFRIRHDLTGILTSMLSDSGGVFPLGESFLLLVITGKSMQDETLLIHQIDLALNDFTQEKLDVAGLIQAVLSQPSNEKELVQFIEKWI